MTASHLCLVFQNGEGPRRGGEMGGRCWHAGCQQEMQGSVLGHEVAVGCRYTINEEDYRMVK